MTAGAAAAADGPDLSAPGALAAFRERFEEQEPRVRAFVAEEKRFERLERAAEELRRAVADGADPGPLHGVPLGVKDIFHVDGLPTRAGSWLPPDALEGAEAPAVTRLRAAGAVVVGKTATTEFAWFSPGPTRNPHDPERTPGGSSSGSAAAVAAGLCPLALGSQTIGSVGRPAAFCGVVGFKPSYDRIPRDGVIPLSRSLDHVGLFAPDVAWARRAAAVLCDDWRGDGSDGADAGSLTLAVPEGPYLERTEPAALERFRATCGRLTDAGVTVRPVATADALPLLHDFDALERRHRRLASAEAAQAHAVLYERYGNLYRPVTAQLVTDGRRVKAAMRRAYRDGRDDLRAELTDGLAAAGADLWLTPGAPGPAPRGLESTGDPALNLPWTYAGLPAVVLPADRLDGMPLGVQLAAPFGADEELLAAAAALERVLDPALGEVTAEEGSR